VLGSKLLDLDLCKMVPLNSGFGNIDSGIDTEGGSLSLSFFRICCLINSILRAIISGSARFDSWKTRLAPHPGQLLLWGSGEISDKVLHARSRR
jgi:hypothetical protein